MKFWGGSPSISQNPTFFAKSDEFCRLKKLLNCVLDKNKKQAAKRKVRVKTTIDHKSVPHSVDIHSLIPAKPYLNFKNKNAFIVIPG